MFGELKRALSEYLENVLLLMFVSPTDALLILFEKISYYPCHLYKYIQKAQHFIPISILGSIPSYQFCIIVSNCQSPRSDPTSGPRRRLCLAGIISLLGGWIFVWPARQRFTEPQSDLLFCDCVSAVYVFPSFMRARNLSVFDIVVVDVETFPNSKTVTHKQEDRRASQ